MTQKCTALVLLLGFFNGWGTGQTGVFQHFRILILGDSLTEGYGVDTEQAYPAILQSILQKTDSRVKVINGGASGSTSASGIRRLKWYEKTKPQVLVLALGSNDGLRGVKVEETKKNVEKVVQYAKQKNWVILITGLKVPPSYGEEYTRKFETIFKEIAEKNDLPYFDFLLDGVAGEPEMNLTDGIHPNEKGHKKIARNLVPFIRKHLIPNDTVKETE